MVGMSPVHKHPRAQPTPGLPGEKIPPMEILSGGDPEFVGFGFGAWQGAVGGFERDRRRSTLARLDQERSEP